MSKAILIIPEIPEECLRCDFGYDQEETVYCSRLEKSVERTDHRPDGCPLRPMPEKKPEKVYSNDFGAEVVCRDYNKGFNDCLEAIEGSGEDASIH